MQFVVIGRDGTDDGALERRTAAREGHLALADGYKENKQFLMAAALKNDAGDMIGSMMLVDFSDRSKLDEWLKVEPYVTGDVWQNIEVFPAAVPASFAKYLPQ